MYGLNYRIADWGTCASSSLLIPATWLSSFTSMHLIVFRLLYIAHICLSVLTYFFALFAVTMGHMRAQPDVWSKTVYSVPWFAAHVDNPQKDATATEPPRPSASLATDSWTVYLENIGSSGVRKEKHPIDDLEKAPWAQNSNIRRGVDPPFARREDDSSSQSSSSGSNGSSASLPPCPPLKVETKSKPVGSRFIERFRESQILVRSESPFPAHVEDDMKPIPLPRMSEWRRASALRPKGAVFT